jgi:hypothetical protein
MTYCQTSQIIRAPHTENFFVAQNQVARDRRLSAKARAVLINLLTRPDNWAINIKFLCAEMCMGVVAVKKALKELESCGYLVRERLRDAIGRFNGSAHAIIESPVVKDDKTPSQPFSPSVQFSTVSIPTVSKSNTIRNTENNNYQNEQILNLSPTPQFLSEEEIDVWSDSYSDSSQVELTPITLEPEPSKIDSCETEQAKAPCNETIPSVDEYSAAAAEKTIVSAVKPTRKERRSARHDATWVEFGQQNGLWQSLEELQSFMAALYAHAVNNPRLHTPSKWVESEVQKTIDRGTGTHWTEYCAGLQVGTIDQKPWADVHGNVNLSFRSYIEQSKMGESSNSTSRAVELAAQVLSNPFKAGLMWNEYQRRLEREVAEKAKCELLGVTYDAPSVLKPKPLIDSEATAQTQQLLRIDDASQVCQPVVESKPVLALEAEVEASESLVGEAPWDAIAEKMLAIEKSQCQPAAPAATGIMEKMERLREKMGFSKPEVTPLSDVYREPKPVDQVEAVEFKAWYDLVKAAGLVDYSYSDVRCHAIVVLVGGEALPWRDARRLLGGG